MKRAKPKSVSARDCSIIAMCDGRNETRHPKVIHEGYVMQYIGIGWISERRAMPEDYRRYPKVK